MILYKYRDCSNYTDAIFKERSVWLSKPSALNDPCECSMHEMAPEWTEEKIREMKQAQISGALLFPDTKFTSELARILPAINGFDEKYAAFRKLNELFYNVRLSNPDELFEKFQRQLTEVGIFSLASTPDHPLLWSHYGANHKGICLGFELRDLTPSTDPARFLRVNYTEEIPRMSEVGFTQEVRISMNELGGFENESAIPFTDRALRAAISTKSTCWSYEGEWRYVEPRGDRSYPLPGPLVEITFGLRCKAEDRKRYLDLASEYLDGDIQLYEIRRLKNMLGFKRFHIGGQSSKRPISHVPICYGPMTDDTSIADTDPELEAMLQHGQYIKVLPILEQALRREPASAKLWRAKGCVLGRQLQHSDALACFERALVINPAFFSAWYQKGVALTMLERFPDAVFAYEKANDLNPTDGSTLYNLAILRFRQGLESEAILLMKKALLSGHPRSEDVLREWEQPKDGS